MTYPRNLLVVSVACCRRRGRRPGLGPQILTELVIETLLYTPW